MRFNRIAAILGAVTATIALSGCIQGAPEGADPGPSFEPAAQVELRDSPVYDAMRARGAVVIGVKEDQPGLGAGARERNLAGAMRASRSTQNREVIVIDDVVTSGSSVREAIRALREAGARPIAVASATRA